MSVEGQQVGDVARRVLELRLGQRSRGPVGARLLLGQPHAEHLLDQRLIAEREPEADQRGGDLGVEDRRRQRAELMEEGAEILAARVQHALDGGAAEHRGQGSERRQRRPRRSARRRKRPRSGSVPIARSRCGCGRTRCRGRASLLGEAADGGFERLAGGDQAGRGARARSGCRWGAPAVGARLARSARSLAGGRGLGHHGCSRPRR